MNLDIIHVSYIQDKCTSFSFRQKYQVRQAIQIYQHASV